MIASWPSDVSQYMWSVLRLRSGLLPLFAARQHMSTNQYTVWTSRVAGLISEGVFFQWFEGRASHAPRRAHMYVVESPIG